MALPSISILGVVAATIIEVFLGAMWFNAPFAFNRQWLRGIGKTAEQVAADASPWSIISAILGAIVTAVVLSLFVAWASANTWHEGALIGLMTAVGFSANIAFIKDRFEGRSMQLSLINAGHDVVILALMGAVIGLLS